MRVLAVVFAALIFAGPALGGGVSAMSDVDGGGSSTPRVYIVQVTTVVNGFTYYWNCEYLDFGNGLVIQNRCW